MQVEIVTDWLGDLLLCYDLGSGNIYNDLKVVSPFIDQIGV